MIPHQLNGLIDQLPPVLQTCRSIPPPQLLQHLFLGVLTHICIHLPGNTPF
jgi:hypothetical protein